MSALSACASLQYYGQAAAGQFSIMQRRVALASAIRDPEASPTLRTRLQRVEEIRSFAINELHLPDSGSFRSYVDLRRPYVLWNVFASPEFELRAVESCFPLVGCLGYRGYYDEADARRFAAGLKAEGHDVYVAGVSAYSTLGWFDDPVLSSMLRWSDLELAGVMFHELAHELLYIRDDSAFNESFATAVQEEGLRRWLETRHAAELRGQAQAAKQRRQDFLKLVEATRSRLRQLYASSLPAENKRRMKAEILDGMRAEHALLKSAWDGFNGYDEWFTDLNNAKLMAVATYHEWTPAFHQALQESDGDLQRFYEEVRRVSKLPRDKRQAWLNTRLPATTR
jgi:predicted aminopeptidase